MEQERDSDRTGEDTPKNNPSASGGTATNRSANTESTGDPGRTPG